MTSLVYSCTAILGSIFAYTAAADSNPLGFYVGGALGRSDVRAEIGSFDNISHESDTAWKVFVGLRPVSLIAGELSYVDFGHPNFSRNLGAMTINSNVLDKASTLSGLIFAPIPLPVLDLYARVGVARLKSSGNGGNVCNPGYECPLIVYNLSFDRTKTDLLYGAGVQAKVSALQIRLEYERIHDSRGDPDLATVGVLWSF